MMRAARRFPVALVAAWLTAGHQSRAQTAPSLDARTWKPPADPDASMVLEPPSTQGPGRWNLSAWTNFAGDPVTLSGTGPVRPVAYLVGADLVASVGIGQRLALGADVPALLWQTGSKGLAPWVVSGGSASTGGLGDVSLHAKVTVVSDDRAGTHAGFGLAALGGVTLPTGGAASFVGDGDVTGSLALLAGYTVGPASARASLGYSLRAEPHAWPQAFDTLPQCNILGGCGVPAGPTYGASASWAVGLTLRPKALLASADAGDRQVWELAAHGAVPAGPVAPVVGTGAATLSPALLAVDDRVGLGHYRDVYFVGGVEIGLDRAVGVPLVRGVLALGWAPRSHDKDDDGVPDDVDQCPELAEDRDGIQDDDGCPEDDADDDGTPDAQDSCPLVPGVASPDPRRNGCPAVGALR